MKCPKCGQEASLVAPKYTALQTVVFRCYAYAHGDGFTFTSDSPEARRESEECRRLSRANAEEIRKSQKEGKP